MQAFLVVRVLHPSDARHDLIRREAQVRTQELEQCRIEVGRSEDLLKYSFVGKTLADRFLNEILRALRDRGEKSVTVADLASKQGA